MVRDYVESRTSFQLPAKTLSQLGGSIENAPQDTQHDAWNKQHEDYSRILPSIEAVPTHLRRADLGYSAECADRWLAEVKGSAVFINIRSRIMALEDALRDELKRRIVLIVDLKQTARAKQQRPFNPCLLPRRSDRPSWPGCAGLTMKRRSMDVAAGSVVVQRQVFPRSAASRIVAMHRTALLASTCLSLALIPAAHAVDGTWIGATGAWTTGINWSTGSVPGSGNTATFTSSGATTAITISGSVSIGTIQLDAGAPAFSFTTAPSGPNFTINGTGIVNNSSNVPTFTVGGGLIFSNSSSAGNAAITNNNFLHFSGDSTAGNATLTNNNGATSFMFFSGNGTAGNATIINNLNSVVNFSSNGPGGTGNTAGSISGAGSYVLNGNRLTTGGNNATTTVSGVISGSGGQLAKAGTGTLTLSGTNTYTGATTINAGVLNVATIGNGGVAGNLGQASNAAANLVLSGGTLRYTGATASTDRAFTLTAGTTSTIDVAANNLTISGASAATTGALIKIGNGTLTFTGANTYTGGTTISAGTLQIGNGGTTGSIAGDILNNSTLVPTI
jgi:autotransporter-associated beta strand protein